MSMSQQNMGKTTAYTTSFLSFVQITTANKRTETDGEVSIFSYIVTAFLMKWQIMYNISDKAVGKLLQFLRSLFSVMACIFHLPKLVQIAGLVPSPLHVMKSLVGLNTDRFEKYVVCPKCDRIYKLDQCYETTSTGKKKSARCKHIEKSFIIRTSSS